MKVRESQSKLQLRPPVQSHAYITFSDYVETGVTNIFQATMAVGDLCLSDEREDVSSVRVHQAQASMDPSSARRAWHERFVDGNL